MLGLERLSPERVDTELGVIPLFVAIAPSDLILLKVLLESFEGIGVIRTQDRCYTNGRALIVVIVVPDFVDDARALLGEFLETATCEVVAETPELLAELKRDLLEG